MKIEAVIRSVYGNLLIYVKDETQAKALEKITGKKTISEENIEGLRELGIEVNVFNPYE